MGDDAMLYALLEELHASEPKAKFAVTSRMPVVIPSQVQSETTFVRLSPLAVAREILKSSVFVVGGGTHINDYGKKRRVLKILSRILALVLYSKLLGKKVYLLNNGFGPIITSWGRLLSRTMCLLADYISARDKFSYEILESFGVTHKASLAFDLSALLEPLDKREKSSCKDGGEDGQILGLSITPVFEIYYGNKEKDLLLVDEITKVINEELGRNHRLRVHLFIFKGKSRDDDVLITRLLQERLQSSDHVQLTNYNPDPREMLSQVARCDAFIGMRYHACLFAYFTNVPLLVIDYHPKCHALADDIGLPPQAVVSLEEVLHGQFSERLRNLLSSPEDFHATLPIALARKRAREGLLKVELS